MDIIYIIQFQDEILPNIEHYESCIWRQVLFDEESMKKLAAVFL